jgi:hypothetical protein
VGSGTGVEVLAERVAHVAVSAVDILRRRSDALLDLVAQDRLPSSKLISTIASGSAATTSPTSESKPTLRGS